MALDRLHDTTELKFPYVNNVGSCMYCGLVVNIVQYRVSILCEQL